MPKDTNPVALVAEFGGPRIWTYNASTKSFVQLRALQLAALTSFNIVKVRNITTKLNSKELWPSSQTCIILTLGRRPHLSPKILPTCLCLATSRS